MLINHLMNLYSSGVISLNSDDGLVECFFKSAPDKIRALTIKTIGRWLHNGEDISVELCESYKALWEWRKQVQDTNPNEHKEEITSFGWMFCNNYVNMDWSLNELHRAIKISGTIEPLKMVAEYLDNESIPVDYALELLNLLIRGIKSQNRWAINQIEKHTKSIINKAINSEESTKQKAMSLKDYLVAFGYKEYLNV